MKRSIGEDAESTSAKRLKRSPTHDFDNPSLLRRVSELDTHDKDGLVNAKVVMTWSDKNTTRLTELETSVSFDVVLGSNCASRLKKCRAQLVSGDHILLSLRGAEIERRIVDKKLTGVVLRYLGDIAFKWISGGKDDSRKSSYSGMVCDTASGRFILLHKDGTS